mgnify:CR=1 FL=1|jgi:AraC family transcriptional activator of pobA
MSSSIPNYALYGDEAQPGWLDLIQIETIPERSSLYDYDIAPHVHDGLIQLLHVTEGGGEVFIDGASWQIELPALIVIPSRHVHGFHFRRSIDGRVITAAQRPLESLAAVGSPDVLAHIRRPCVLPRVDSVRHAEALAPLFDAIARETRLHSRGEATASPALLLALFVHVARIADALQVRVGEDAAARTRKAAQVDRFRALVDSHFRERWPIERYAQEVGVSAGQLSRLCRDVLGHSALDVVNARVMHEAERELVYSILGVKQIAAVLGFADEAYFGRFFKKQTGRTPTEFRLSVQQQLAPEPRSGIS